MSVCQSDGIVPSVAVDRSNLLWSLSLARKTLQADRFPTANRLSGVNMKWIMIGMLGIGFVLAVGVAAFWRPAESAANRSLPHKLFTTHPGKLRDDYQGIVGGEIAVASDRDVKVTHLGYCDANGDGLQVDHRVGLYEPSTEEAKKGKPLVEAIVPYGAGALLEDGYRWVALKSPVVLKANQRYLLAAEVIQSVNDPWPDMELASDRAANGARSSATAIPDWNEAFIGVQPAETRIPRHSHGKWPAELDQQHPDYNNSMYGAANLAFEAAAGN